jgi:hypothetical protein
LPWRRSFRVCACFCYRPGLPSWRLACLSYSFSYSLSTLVLSLQIHAHLPALLRLPRQWTLFYSLDQHGISLNTLYARCAPPSSSRPPHPKGALVVMQDAAGMLFGAWVADGLRRSTRGGYYGGGESCVLPPSSFLLAVF